MVHAPENTLAAFRKAWEEGADGVECDVHISRDGAIMVHHDATLWRITGLPVKIADSTRDELERYDVGVWKGPEWAQQRIPTLEDVLKETPAGRVLYIEIKCGPHVVRILEEMARQAVVTPERVRWIGFDLDTMAAVKKAMPQFEVLLNIEPEEYEGNRAPAERILKTVREAGLDGVGAGIKRVDETALSLWKSSGLDLFAWTVKDAKTAARLRELEIEAAAADCPAMLRRWLQTG